MKCSFMALAYLFMFNVLYNCKYDTDSNYLQQYICIMLIKNDKCISIKKLLNIYEKDDIK